MHSCFDLVFACFCFVTLHQVILTFPRLESNPERVWLWRHVTKPSAHTNTFSIPHKYKHNLPQYCGQFCIFPCSIAPFPHRSLFWVILIAHRSDSWSPEVYYTLLHTVAALDETWFWTAFFTLLCQFSRIFPLWHEITPILSIPRWKNFSCFGCF
uniref:(northern house mosquito) hypothetical protein n=1 Tax=Culex pipiens TaxID=7175 RepID=A0A8D8F8Y6_CULPI